MTTIAEQLNTTQVLSKYQLEQFIEEGYDLVRQALLREESSAAFNRLWKEAKAEVGVYSNKPSTWSCRPTIL